MSLYVKCRVCGKRFRVKLPFLMTYDLVIGHIENRHPAAALTTMEEIGFVDSQLPDEFHRAVMEGNSKEGNLT